MWRWSHRHRKILHNHSPPSLLAWILPHSLLHQLWSFCTPLAGWLVCGKLDSRDFCLAHTSKSFLACADNTTAWSASAESCPKHLLIVWEKPLMNWLIWAMLFSLPVRDWNSFTGRLSEAKTRLIAPRAFSAFAWGRDQHKSFVLKNTLRTLP